MAIEDALADFASRFEPESVSSTPAPARAGTPAISRKARYCGVDLAIGDAA
jgi:hypothetical protein